MGITYIYAYNQGNHIYVGKTKDLNKRKSYHKKRFENWNYNVIDSINSLDKNEWKPLECYWIEQFRQWGYNLENKNNGGNGPNISKTEEELKQKHLEGVKKWQNENPAKQKASKKKADRKYFLANKEKRDEYMKQWRLSKKQISINRTK